MGRQSNGNFGTDIVLTGDQAYRATMKDIASQMRLVKSELALADAEYKNNDDSVAALTARYGALQKQYDLEREKVGQVADQLAKAKTEYGEGSQQVRYWETQLNNANAAAAKTEGAMRAASQAVEGSTTSVSAAEAKEKTYQASLAELNQKLKLNESELKLTTAAYSGQAGSVDALKAKQSGLDTAYDLQKQKVELIRSAMTAAGTEYGQNSAQVTELKTQLNGEMAALLTAEQAQRSNTDAVKAGEGAQQKETVVTRAAESAKRALTTAITATADAMKTGLVAAAKAAGAAIAGLAAATGAAVKTGFDWTKQAGENVDGLMTLSTQTGVSAANLQKWDYAARFIDTDVSTMTGSMSKMTKQMGEASKGSTSAGDKFKALGVNIYNSNGSLRDSEDVFMDAIDALGKVSNESERDAMAMDLFGKSAQELNPLIEAGGDKLKELGDEAKHAGLVMGGSALDALGGFDDAMQRFDATGKGLKNTIASVLVPVFQPFVDTATGAMGQISAALADGLQPGELNNVLQSTLLTLKTSIASVGKQLTDAMPMISAALSGLVGVVVTTLPGLITTLLPAAMGLLQSVLDAIVANVGPLTKLAVDILTQLAGFLTTNVPTLLSAAGDILTGLIDGIIAALPDLIPMAVTMLASLATALVGAIPEITARLPEIVDAIWQGLQAVDWLSLGLNLLKGLANGLQSALTSVGTLITGVFSAIWKSILKVFGIASPSTEAASAAGFILDGLVQGFETAVDAVVDTVKRIFGKIWDAIKSIFGFGGGESDESKESKQAGSDIMTGMKEGIAGGEEDVKAVAREVATKVLDAIKTELGITEEGGSAVKLQYVGQGAINGLAEGLNTQSATAFTGPAYNAAHYLAVAFNTNLGIAGYGFSAAGNSATKFNYIGSAICDGIVAGLNAGSNRVTAAAQEVAQAAYNAAKLALEIESPSKKFRWLAEMSTEGYAQGLTSRIAGLRARVASMAGTLTQAESAGGGQNREGIDYDRLAGALADAMDERGMGETALYVDGQKLGETRVADGVGRRLRRRADAGINGRSARLVIA